MNLAGQWKRRIFSAAGATVIAPAAVILAALAVGILGGGLRGIGSLDQALTGPKIPVAATAPSTDEGSSQSADQASELLGAAQAADARRPADATAPDRDGGSGGAGGPAGGGGGGTGNDGGNNNDNNGNNGNNGGNNGGNNPQPSNSPEPSVVRETGDQVRDVVKQAPIVGDTGAEVVEELVDTVDQLCPPPACPQKSPAPKPKPKPSPSPIATPESRSTPDPTPDPTPDDTPSATPDPTPGLPDIELPDIDP